MKRIILYCVFFFALIVETSCGSRISNIESEKSALPQKMEGVKPEQKQAIRESLNITFEDALGNRNTRKNTYDYQNRLTEAVAKEKKTGRETVDTYSYNAYGDVATQDDTSFVYNDVSGQVTKETTKLTKNKDVVKNYSYDSAGNKSAFAVKVGDDTKLSLQYTYDGASKLTAVTDEDGKVVDYSYDTDGNLSERTVAGNGMTTTYAYDYQNRLTSLKNQTGKGVISEYTSQYLTNGQKAKETADTIDEDGKKSKKTATYTYDLLGRITKEKKTGCEDISYTYDSNNNRKEMTIGNKVTAYKYNKNDELLRTDTPNTDTEEDSVVIYKNDKNGNQLATVNRYEIPSDKKDSSYVDIDVTLGDNRLNENVVNHYNAMNQLTQTLTKNYKVSFNYDAEGLRTSKTVNGEKTVFVWDGDQLVMELSESGKVQKRYVRGNDLVYADKGENTKKQYYVTDPHGNVVQLTDESGKVTKIYEYDSFGNEVNPDSKDDNPFRYCGEYYDKETEEIYLRARYYQPEVGRFLTRDTYTGEDDEPESLHLYTYCENDGVNCFDPSGHKKVDWTNKLNKAMREHALNFNKFLIKQDERVLSKWYIPFYAAHVEVQKMEYFCKAVKTGGKWDLKSKKKWKFKRNNKYYYNGIELRADDPGNIHFGYVGSVYLPVEVLCTGAGIYQIKTDYTKEKISKMDIQKIMQGTGKLLFGRGDDPRDQFMIRYGNALFHKDILKSILKVTG